MIHFPGKTVNDPDFSSRIKIIQLDNRYCNEILGLILPIQQNEFNLPITISQQPDLEDIEKYYVKFWGAEVEGKIVGTIGLLSAGQERGAIRKMFVVKEYRGKEWQVATHLLRHLIEYCRQQSIADLYLGTIDSLKAAIKFYSKMSFQPITRESLPAEFPLMAVDNIFFHLHIS
ncbi:GNAT family N-acetyltransferase [Dyadobacter sp. CY327]|uniref:GNAT family N-acetyltransferase n=1 Tax=Dyadobacter sp. CY327 TaxID=2907301 RepID=UPI001F2893F7|nr:GNAT family N-acetyltransferase [Dyadobacter sp. CY327]MCE7072592.1 GNAT family N-acetyltransferase [Dyadobacter sp. CY327]